MTQDQGRREPKNEQEAQELKRYLERGGTVKLDRLRRAEAEHAALAATGPAVLPLPDSAAIVAQLANAGTDTIGLLELTFSGVEETPGFAVRVFVNTPDADARTPTTAPGFVGKVAFFCHTTERGGKMVCVVHGEGLPTFRLNATEALRRTGSRGPATVTLVPIGRRGRKLDATALDVTAAINLMRSEVVVAS